jgi:hypothetical protein
MNRDKFHDSGLFSVNAILLYISLFKLILLIVFAGNYGIFRDEFYYIECSKNLDWGFVDQQPISVFLLAISRFIFGESLLGIRIFSYLAGSAIVFMSGIIARELGGTKFAQSFTALMVTFSGVVLGVSGYFSMNSFDILLSTIFFYYLVRLIKTQDSKIWIKIGIVFGLGLLNKLTFLFLGFGLFVGLILTQYRKELLNKYLWIGAGIAFIMILPNIVWQIANDFSTYEFIRNAALYKNQPMGFIDFTLNAMLELNPGFIPFLLIALYLLIFNKEGRKYLIIALIFFTMYLVFVINNGKPYYMGILYPALLAIGAVGADILIERYLKNYIRPLLLILVIPSALIVTPLAIPVLSVEDLVKFQNITGIKPASGERSELGALPQFFADRFGWEEMVEKVAEAYEMLSDEEKEKALVFGQNYGEAGAVDYYRDKYGLPDAISSHNNYWLWGYPEGYTGEVMIVIGSTREDNLEFFEEVELAASHRHPYAMPYENVDIFICRGLKIPMKELWKRAKRYI